MSLRPLRRRLRRLGPPDRRLHPTDLTREFDTLVHQPTRLQIFASFYRHEETAFPTLVDELEVTEGNLSSHLQRMEEADAVAVEKAVVDRTSRTTYELTSAGRELFEEHIGRLEAPIDGLTEE